MRTLTVSDSTVSPVNQSLVDFNLSNINTSGNKSGNKSIYTNAVGGNEFVKIITHRSKFKPDLVTYELRSEKYFKLMREVRKEALFYKRVK